MVICIGGPTTAGKTTILKRLLEMFPDWKYIPRYTTRKPRKSEKPGVDYHFMPLARYQDQVQQGEIHASYRFGATFYGVSLKEIYQWRKRMGRTVIGDFGPCSLPLKKIFDEDAILIYIYATTTTLERRVRRERQEESPGEFRRRMGDIEEGFRKHGAQFDCIVLNDDDTSIEAAVHQIVVYLRRIEVERGVKIVGFSK